ISTERGKTTLWKAEEVYPSPGQKPPGITLRAQSGETGSGWILYNLGGIQHFNSSYECYS
ncbi:MAG: hypothetical protein M1541_09495, partial [Acidobacteria bacterium]|nr:hypothetical protein [Acidobacteriota bacterium]